MFTRRMAAKPDASRVDRLGDDLLKVEIDNVGKHIIIICGRYTE